MPTFVVYARRNPELLARVVSLFHRRAMEIKRLAAEHVNNPNTLRMEIEIEADEQNARLIEANLHKLVDVMSVEQYGSAAEVPPPDDHKEQM